MKKIYQEYMQILLIKTFEIIMIFIMEEMKKLEIVLK